MFATIKGVLSALSLVKDAIALIASAVAKYMAARKESKRASVKLEREKDVKLAEEGDLDAIDRLSK